MRCCVIRSRDVTYLPDSRVGSLRLREMTGLLLRTLRDAFAPGTADVAGRSRRRLQLCRKQPARHFSSRMRVRARRKTNACLSRHHATVQLVVRAAPSSTGGKIGSGGRRISGSSSGSGSGSGRGSDSSGSGSCSSSRLWLYPTAKQKHQSLVTAAPPALLSESAVCSLRGVLLPESAVEVVRLAGRTSPFKTLDGAESCK